MSDYFSDKVAIVTGSSGGIGKAIALELSRRGARVVINGRNEQKILGVLEEIKGNGYEVLSVKADIASYTDCLNLVEETVRKFGKIDILINNAGLSCRGDFEDLEPEVFKAILDTNLMGSIYMTKAALPYLKKNAGRIMFVGSAASFYGLRGFAPYAASKMALTSLVEALDLELFNTGIAVGITYVGVTHNDPGKQVMGPQGEKITLENRSADISLSQESVAKRIVRNVEKSKFKSVMTLPGKALFYINRISPSLVRFFLKQFRDKLAVRFK